MAGPTASRPDHPVSYPGAVSYPGPDRAGPLRLALVVPPYYAVPPVAYGGVEAVVADLADALVDRGHRVTLIGAGSAGTRARFVGVWPEPLPQRLGEPFPEVVHAALTRRTVEALIADEGLDVVHDHTLAGPLNAAGYRALGVPTVVTMHGPVSPDLRQLYGTLASDIGLVAISHRQRELAPELPWVGTVPNAIQAGTFPYRRDKDDYALFLGRFHPDKGPHLALEAAHRAGLPLVLAGKCTEAIEREYFATAVRPRLTASDRVVGEANALTKRSLLAGARCLLFPIQWEEPFGMVMIEAMACGTPVVALRGGAVDEIVRAGRTGFVADDLAGLVDALRRVDTIDPAECRAHVGRHFTVEAMAAGYESVYRAVRIGPGPRRPSAGRPAVHSGWPEPNRAQSERAPVPGAASADLGRRPLQQAAAKLHIGRTGPAL